MINNLINLIVKYGTYGGAVTAAVTMDGNRITVINDNKFGQINMNQKEREALENKNLLEDKVQEELIQTKNKVNMVNYKEAADEHYKAQISFNKDEYNKFELEKANKKLMGATSARKLAEPRVEELKNLDLSGIFSSLYNNYLEFISNLSGDKLVCVFNIIIDGLVFSSFLTVLGIMLSEQVINKIT